MFAGTSVYIVTRSVYSVNADLLPPRWVSVSDSSYLVIKHQPNGSANFLTKTLDYVALFSEHDQMFLFYFFQTWESEVTWLFNFVK